MISPKSPYTRRVNEDRVNEDREHGPQPLDALMTSWGLGNHDLVDASLEQLTHKQVQRARSGRRLTLKMMMKVTRALNIAIWNRLKAAQREEFVEYLHKDIFSYSKGYDGSKADPNVDLLPGGSGRQTGG